MTSWKSPTLDWPWNATRPTSWSIWCRSFEVYCWIWFDSIWMTSTIVFPKKCRIFRRETALLWVSIENFVRTYYIIIIYRVGQIKWHHFTFLLVTHECIDKILWFLAHINYIMQKMRWWYVYVIMSTLIRQRALQTWILSICIIAV